MIVFFFQDFYKQHKNSNYYINIYLFFKWYYSENPDSVDMIPYQTNKYFDVLMLIRCFRIDRVYQAVENYIYQTIGISNESCIYKKNIK